MKNLSIPPAEKPLVVSMAVTAVMIAAMAIACIVGSEAVYMLFFPMIAGMIVSAFSLGKLLWLALRHH